MLSAVFCAIEEDNKTGLEELLAMANIDISQVSRGQYLPQSEYPMENITSIRLDMANIYRSQVRHGQYLPQSG